MERIVAFGPEGQLSGIAAGEGASPAARVGVVLLSPGLLHRVGNSRFNVLLSRRLAAAGIPSLRFDFSGNGDSPRRAGVARTYESAIEEVRWAVAELQRSSGVGSVILVGHCSGADVAQRAAVQEPAVTGLFLTDPIAFRTPYFLLKRYFLRLFDPRAILRAPRTIANLRKGPLNPDWARQVPERAVLVEEMTQLVRRGVRFRTVFTGGVRDYYGYEGQYRSAFGQVPFGPLLREHLISEADHVLAKPNPRSAVVDLAIDFASESAGK